MKNTILILLSTMMVLLAFSSCDETELINPREERTILDLNTDEEINDDNENDGMYGLEAEEAEGVRTTVGGTATADNLMSDPMNAEADLTLRGYTDLANGVNNTTNDATIRTSYDNDGQTSTTDPIDPTDATRISYSDDGTIGETSPITTNNVRSSYGSTVGSVDNTSPQTTSTTRSSYRSTDNLTPVLPEDTRARTLKSKSSSMQ